MAKFMDYYGMYEDLLDMQHRASDAGHVLFAQRCAMFRVEILLFHRNRVQVGYDAPRRIWTELDPRAPYKPPDAAVNVLNLKINQNIYYAWEWWTVVGVDFTTLHDVVTVHMRSMREPSRTCSTTVNPRTKFYTEKELCDHALKF